MRVLCSIEETELEGDHGPIDSVIAICSRCDHETESYGTSEASIRRCLVLMRKECPNDECNFYVSEDGSEEDEFYCVRS